MRKQDREYRKSQVWITVLSQEVLLKVIKIAAGLFRVPASYPAKGSCTAPLSKMEPALWIVRSSWGGPSCISFLDDLVHLVTPAPLSFYWYNTTRFLHAAWFPAEQDLTVCADRVLNIPRFEPHTPKTNRDSTMICHPRGSQAESDGEGRCSKRSREN
jgi:hypothetical protein